MGPTRGQNRPGGEFPSQVDHAAERAVLGAALFEPAAIKHLRRLRPEDFDLEKHRDILQAGLTVADRGEPLDHITLVAELEARGVFAAVGGHTTIAVLTEEAALATQTPIYVKRLRDLRLKRELERLGHQLQTGARNGQPAAEVLAEFERHLAELQQSALSAPVDPLAVGLGAFLAERFPAPDPYIEGLLSDDGGGFRGGEEKLGKTLYCLHEALCLALGELVLGRFKVPRRRRVLFVEEEDSPRRVWRRLRALLWGLGIDPDDSVVHAGLNDWLRLSVWQGFTFDVPAMMQRLDSEIAAFRPDVVYIDALRKVTLSDLTKADQAGVLLARLDDLRRRYGVVFLLIHHYRKTQGVRAGRGSQELSGSYVLGAWGENSLFFEPIGRRAEGAKVETQSKDLPPIPPFKMVIQAEGEPHDPRVLRLRAEELAETTVGAQNRTKVFAALRNGDSVPADEGKAGVPVSAIVATTKLSDKSVRAHLKELWKDGLVQVAGYQLVPRPNGKGATKVPLWISVETATIQPSSAASETTTTPSSVSAEEAAG
jgi:DNA-binding transcriptional ArsR family regulator